MARSRAHVQASEPRRRRRRPAYSVCRATCPASIQESRRSPPDPASELSRDQPRRARRRSGLVAVQRFHARAEVRKLVFGDDPAGRGDAIHRSLGGHRRRSATTGVEVPLRQRAAVAGDEKAMDRIPATAGSSPEYEIPTSRTRPWNRERDVRSTATRRGLDPYSVSDADQRRSRDLGIEAEQVALHTRICGGASAGAARSTWRARRPPPSRSMCAGPPQGGLTREDDMRAAVGPCRASRRGRHRQERHARGVAARRRRQPS